MDFGDSLLAKAVIFLGPIFVVAGWVKSYLFWKIDPKKEYQIETFAGGAVIDGSKKDIPKKMIKIEHTCNRVRGYTLALFVSVCVCVIVLRVF